MPHHCSQMTGCLRLSATSLRSVLVKVASSASTSVQASPSPNTIDRSFSSTQPLRRWLSLFSMSSMVLWLRARMRWMAGCETRLSSKNSKADWVCKGVWLLPLPSTKIGCRWWGLMYDWQPLRLQRCLGIPWPTLGWSFDSVPFPHRGHILPVQSCRRPSARSSLTTWESLACSKSANLRLQATRSPRCSWTWLTINLATTRYYGKNICLNPLTSISLAIMVPLIYH